jgi:hypothetical protein
MRRWAILTVFLYAVVISILAAPLIYFLGEGDRDEYLGGFLLILVPVLVAIQAILLLIPVAVTRERPIRRRTVATSAVIGAFPMALLVASSVWWVLNMLFGEDTALDEPVAWAMLGLLGILWLFWEPSS